MLATLLQFFFPSYCVGCNETLNPYDGVVCPDCDTNLPLLEAGDKSGVGFLGRYEKTIRQLIRRWKFKGSKSCARYLVKKAGPQLTGLINRHNIQLISFMPSSDPKRFREIAKFIDAEFGLPSVQLLTRPKRRHKQHGLDRAGRFLAIHGSMQPVVAKRPRVNVLLIDDVFTTGATFAEARRVLEGMGIPSVTGFCFAYRPVVLEQEPHAPLEL